MSDLTKSITKKLLDGFKDSLVFPKSRKELFAWLPIRVSTIYGKTKLVWLDSVFRDEDGLLYDHGFPMPEGWMEFDKDKPIRIKRPHQYEVQN